MLPLTPPPLARDPGYPVRARLLADPALRRHALAALAALALGGCDGTGTQPPASATSVPTARPPPVESRPAPAQPGEEQPPVELVDELPVAMSIAGGIRAIAEPEPKPARLVGEVVAPEPPAPLPVQIVPAEPIEIRLPLPPDGDT
jgi:hypothetical protein